MQAELQEQTRVSTLDRARATATEAELQRVRDEISTLRAQMDQLRLEAPRVVAQERNAGTAARLSALIESKKNLFGYGLPFLDHNGGIDETFAQLFDLTPAERSRITQIIKESKTTIERMELQNAKAVRNEKGEVELSVRPFAEEGGKIYDDALAQVAETLGPERHRAFVSLVGDSFEHSFSRFGAKAKTFTITHRIDGTGFYEVSEKWDSSDMNGTSGSRFIDQASLRKFFGHLAPLLPENL